MTGIPARLDEHLAGRYRIECEIGRGGMAIVYLAQDIKHGRRVAMKVLRPELSTELGTDRFLREIEFGARLTHPNVLTLHDSGRAGDLLYYVMPYVEGESLRDRLTRERQLSFEDVIRIVRETAEALGHAHTLGVIHRDIKPENILLSDGHAVVSDFGIARAVDVAGSERLTVTGFALGTPAYMSPEQSAGDGVLDHRADIYSLACVAYEMIAGTPPFVGSTPAAILARHAVDAMPPLRSVRSTVPESVERVIEKALAKVPADRYSTANEFAVALERAFATGEGRVAGMAKPWRGPWIRRAARGIASGAVLILAVVAFREYRNNRAPLLTSIALLPFDNLAGDSTQDPFVAGMKDALAGALGQVGSLRVVWETVQPYGGTTRPTAEIAAELGVDGVVQGTVLRHGDSVHLQVRLIQARPVEQLVWSQGYDHSIGDILSVHGRIAAAIAQTARTRLTPDQERRLARARTTDPEMYELYVRGMFHLDKGTPHDRRRGVAYLEQAVQRDPGSALAYSGLAYGYVSIGHEPESPPDAWQRAKGAAERAMALDPALAEAHAVLADVKLYYEYDWAGAEAAFRRANELNPNLAMNHYHYAWYLVLFERFDEAIAEHKRAQELDPLRPLHTVWLAEIYVYGGRYDDAIAEARKVLERDTLNATAHYVIGNAYLAQGRHGEAIASHERAAALSPFWLGSLGVTYARAGRVEDARDVLTRLEALPVTPYRALARALLYSALGDMDLAFRWLDYRPAHAWLPWVRMLPNLENLRGDPRYFGFTRRLNLPP